MIKDYNKKTMATASALVIGLFSLLSSGCAQQATSPQMQNELKILERRVVALEQQKLKTLADLREEVAEFKEQSNLKLEAYRKSHQFFIEELNTLKNDLQLITNDNELTQRNFRKNSARLDRINKRLGDQVVALQELKSFFESSIDSSIDSKRNDPDQEKTDFESAFSLFKARNFQEAEKEFTRYRKTHPQSNLVDDSLYYIGYMAFLQGDYSKSSLRLFELLKQYPKSNKRDDAKWWLGVSLERSGDLNGALDLYRELLTLKPDNPLRIRAEFRIEELSPMRDE